MVKLLYLNYVELEFDTETKKTRILKQWTTPTKGKATKKPKVQSTIQDAGEILI